MTRYRSLLFLAVAATVGLLATSANAQLWTPAEITTTMWFDAEDGSTITLGANGVSNWADKSGNGFDVSQGSDDRRPDLLAGGWSNGNDSLALTQYGAGTTRKDTLGRNVTSDGISGSAYTLFVVVDAQSVDTEEWIHTAIDTNGKENRHQINSNAVKVRSDGSNGGTTNGAYVSGEQILQFTLDSTLSEVRRNGTQIAGNSGTYVPAALTGNFSVNGRNPIDGHAGMTGELGEFIYLASNPSTDDRQLIEGYLAWKWGLESSLPSGHPYENAAPTLGGTLFDTADFDTDGDVDGDDFGLWSAGFGIATGALKTDGDADEDGDVDGDDFGLWSAQFGNVGPPSAGASVSAVPEPTSLSLLALGSVAMLARRRR